MAEAMIFIEHQYSGSKAIKDAGGEGGGIQYVLIPVFSVCCVHTKGLIESNPLPLQLLHQLGESGKPTKIRPDHNSYAEKSP
jgi:hypothetical protein